ncbi:MAG: AIR synthase-related protein, partial [Ginsengibacter sp.]
STIDRNKNLIPGEVLEQIIKGSQEFFDKMKNFEINIYYLGGETADVGDVVRTIAVNGTMTARWPKNRIISNEKIRDGNVIVGLASFGQTTYEDSYNSGIGSNGLTSARHDLLNKFYADSYKESYDNSMSGDVVYIGKCRLSDSLSIARPDDHIGRGEGQREVNIGKLLLSPTTTYAPLIKNLLANNFEKIFGLIHCSGGGQTKCLKFIPENVRVIKDNLFEPPLIFKLIQETSGCDDREMYQVFNMGCRMEIYTDEDFASVIIREANRFGIKAQVIGRVETSDKKGLVIKNENEAMTFY